MGKPAATLEHVLAGNSQCDEDGGAALVRGYFAWVEQSFLQARQSRDPRSGGSGPAPGHDAGMRALADDGPTVTADAKALAALLCFQASRVDADELGGSLALFGYQAAGRLDSGLVREGLGYLRAAMGGDCVSRYHLEAGIASIYATAPGWEHIDWTMLRAYYDRLLTLVDSFVVVIDSAVVEAFSGEPERALAHLDALGDDPGMVRYAPYHIARAEVLRMLGRGLEANISYSEAIASGASAPAVVYFEDLRTA